MPVTIDKISGKPLLHEHKVADISDANIYLLSNMWYGIRRAIDQTSPTFTRIGNTDLHKVVGGLPIQNKMRRCLVTDAGAVNYYLHPANSLLKENGTPAILDGTDGNVMVEIPQHYYRAWYEAAGGTVYENYAVSEYALPGFTIIEKHYISAYEAALNRSTLKLASVVNNSATYRGGNNTSAWDAAVNSLLGMPVTNLTRANERAYSAAKGAGWCEEPYSYFWPWRWLGYVEYATTNLQTAINNTPDANGYRQGGLGNGITDAVSAEWNTFNAYNPFAPCGITNSLGNNSGEVTFIKTDFGGTGINRTFKANSYRGIENPYGHIWKRVDGINIQRTGGKVNVYAKSGVSGFIDDTVTGYTLIGELPYTSGYILNNIFSNGIILPSKTGGGATTGFCDYYEAPGSDGWRAPLFSASASAAGDAGFACVTAILAASYTYAYFGARLCYKA